MVCGPGFLTLSVLLIRGSCSDETDAGNDEGADRRGDHNHDAAPVKKNCAGQSAGAVFRMRKIFRSGGYAGTPVKCEKHRLRGGSGAGIRAIHLAA